MSTGCIQKCSRSLLPVFLINYTSYFEGHLQIYITHHFLSSFFSLALSLNPNYVRSLFLQIMDPQQLLVEASNPPCHWSSFPHLGSWSTCTDTTTPCHAPTSMPTTMATSRLGRWKPALKELILNFATGGNQVIVCDVYLHRHIM